MKNPVLHALTCLGVAVPLCCCLHVSAAVAGEVSVPNRVPLESMNEADYENYHTRLNQQVNGVASDTNEQKPAVEEKAPAADKAADQEANSGYGKGYRARMERGGRSGRAGGGRGGSMTRGGGGRNR